MRKLARKKVEDLKVIDIYNTQGKASAIKFIKSTYGVTDAYYVLRRLKANQLYIYDSDSDLFRKSTETPFMELDELCVDAPKKSVGKKMKPPERATEIQFDSIVQEMVKERFLEYSRFIQSNSYDRTWRINKTALQAAGYQLELY